MRVPVTRSMLPYGVALVLLPEQQLVIDLDQSAADTVAGATAIVRCITDRTAHRNTDCPTSGPIGVPS